MDQDRMPPKPSDSTAPGKRLASGPSTEKRPGGGKRLEKTGSFGAVKVAALAVALLAALFTGYAALCSWVGAKIPEGTTVELQPGGQVLSLGGLSTAEAKELLSQSIEMDGSQSLTVICGGQQEQISAQVLAPDSDAMLKTLAEAEDLAISRPFFTRGLGYLLDRSSAARPARLRLDGTYRFSAEGEAQVDALLDKLAQAVETEPAAPTYMVGEESVEVVCGTPGAALDREKAKASILDALAKGLDGVELFPEPRLPCRPAPPAGGPTGPSARPACSDSRSGRPRWIPPRLWPGPERPPRSCRTS